MSAIDHQIKSPRYLLTLIFLTSILSLKIGSSYSQPTDPLSKKQLRQQKRIERKQAKEQLQFKSDSIKIAAMLQLRNATEDDDKDSLKKVMKDAKKLAKADILKSNEAKQVNKELDPYLTHYKKYKSKLVLDSANQKKTLNDSKNLGLAELKKQDQYKELSKDLKPYTKELNRFKTNPLDSANPHPWFVSSRNNIDITKEPPLARIY